MLVYKQLSLTIFLNYDTRLSQKPFTVDYFAGDDEKVRFYTGLPSFDILKTIFEFIKPFLTGRCLTLALFQEFILVSVKLRLDVPCQDLAYRFDISLSAVSWIFGMDDRYGYKTFSTK